MADSFIADSFMPDTPVESKKGRGTSGSWETKPLSHPKLPLEVMVNPEGPLQHAASMAMTAPLFGVGGKVGTMAAKGLGTLAEKAAPALGRMATGAGIGAASSAARGESAGSMGLHAAADAIITGLVEASLGKLAKPSKAIAKQIEETIAGNASAKAAYEWAKRAPQDAMEAIKSRVPQTLKFFEVPAIGKDPMTLQDAVTGLAKLRGKDYEDALIQLKRQLNLLEFTPSIPRAGESFEKRVSPYIKDPVPTPIPKNPREAVGSDATRAVADTLATHDVFGVPMAVGAIPLAGMIPGAASKVAGRVLGGMLGH